MMKALFVLFTILLTVNNFAYQGKYRFAFNTPWGEEESVTFLMNSSADIKILDNDNYFKVSTSMFFGEVTLNFETGGDEDYLIAKGIVAKNGSNTDLISFCAAIIDGPNRLVQTTGLRTAKFEKWNKMTKSYEIPDFIATEKEIKNCENELLDDYEARGFDISEY